MIYLDHNATTPMLPEVAAAMAECYTAVYANPASAHQAGRRARQVLEDSRESIAAMLGVRLDGAQGGRLIFTSGGTESNNLAILGLSGDSHARVVVSSIEHPSVLEPADELARRGWDVERSRVSSDGVVDLEHLAAVLDDRTRVASVMFASNETGVIQPIQQIASLCARYGIPLHTDAVAAVGKLPIDFASLGAATLSASAHKFHGPRGIGLLAIGGGITLRPSLFGGPQQHGLRPGTEDVALAVGMELALRRWNDDRHDHVRRMTHLRDRFESRLRAGWHELVIHGASVDRVGQTSNVAFLGLDRQALLMALDLAGVACSVGSACSSGSSELSPTLVAMGCETALLESSLRFSMGTLTTEFELDEAVRRILRVCHDLRGRTSEPIRPTKPREKSQKAI